MFPTTRDFVAALDRAGELTRIKTRVSPILGITELADRESKSPAPSLPCVSTRHTDPRFHHLGGKALLFENVEGSDIPVLINAFGSYRRMEIALGCNDAGAGLKRGHTPGGLESLAARLGQLAKPEPPSGLAAKLRKLPELLQLARIPPRRVRSGICQEIVYTGDAVDLKRLPLIRCWPLDGDLAAVDHPADANDHIPGVEKGADWNERFRGRYITLAGIHTIHADDRDHANPPSRNIGVYRVQLLGKRTMAMHWHVHHDGARHWRSWRAIGKKMPVAIALGGESVLPYAATAPMPPGMSELLLAGFLNRGGIPLVRCKTVPLDVPANSEIVIEGWVDTEPSALEGPFGDHTGFYSLPDRYPPLTITAITHRRDPIYPTTVVGLPPQEDYFMGKATERLFRPLLRTLIPDIIDYDLPMFGAFHNAALVKIRKEYPLQARRVMSSIWGAGQMAWTKTIVVVDDDVDVHDHAAVLRAVGEHCLPARDIELTRGPVDILDHAAPFLGAGAKMGLDATRKLGDAETHRAPPLDSVAAEACEAGPILPALGEAARTSEARMRRIPGVLDASIPAEFGGHWLLIRAAKDQPGDGARIVKALGPLPDEVALPRWTIIVGPDVDIRNFDDALFHWFANTCPERDRFLSVCGRRIAFDATPKLLGDERNGLPVRAWPPIIRLEGEAAAASPNHNPRALAEHAATLAADGRTNDARRAFAQALGENDTDPRILFLAFQFHFRAGELDAAERFVRRRLDLAAPDSKESAHAFGNLGLVLHHKGDLDAAEAAIKRAIDIDTRLGDELGLARDTGNLGLIPETRGDLDRAEALFREALAIAERLGAEPIIASKYANLGDIALARGHHAEARDLWTRAVAIFERLGPRKSRDEYAAKLAALCEIPAARQ